MKYIVFKCTYSKGLVQKVPVIFPEFMVHKVVAEYMVVMFRREHGMTDVRPISAGLVELGGTYALHKGKPVMRDGVTVSGESMTLKIKSDPDDASLINHYQYTQGLL